MAGRRTNLALLVLLAAALLTGALAYAIGTSLDRVVTVTHGIVGVAIVALSPWKSVIAQRGLRRRRAGSSVSLWLTTVVVLALVTGFLHSTGLLVAASGITAMQIHVAAALICIPLGIHHVRARHVRVDRTDLGRRQMLRSGALLGGSALAYLAIEGSIRALSLAGGRRRFTGSFESGSFDPVRMPVTQWLDDAVQEIETSSWQLQVRRPGEPPTRISHDRLDRERVSVRATIDCTGGWFAHQEWEGVPLGRVLGTTTGRSIVVTSLTGYARRFPMSDAEHLMLATRAGGELLSAGHGAPVRLVAPGRRGFWWVKWVASVEVNDVPWWVQSPFPLT